ncbi:MAG: hypothetical protein ACI4ML_03070 [Aristaeellaceae bacterium]
MKRAIIGGFLSLTGSIWTLAVLLCANSYAISGWVTPPGKLMTQLNESGLMSWFAVSVGCTALGIVLMAIEYCRKDR